MTIPAPDPKIEDLLAGTAFADLPRMSFSRAPSAGVAEDLAAWPQHAYGVRSGKLLRREFENRKLALQHKVGASYGTP